MNRGIWIGAFGLLAVVGVARAHEEGDHAAQEKTLTGEVVDIVCYLNHGPKGLGKDHAGCAKQCIRGGLPVGIKSGDQIYLAALADHTAANAKLAEFAGEQVKATGRVLEKDGQHLFEISKIEKAE